MERWSGSSCLYEGPVGGYEQFWCSGDTSGTTVIGAVGNDRFVIEPATFGRGLTIISGGGNNVVDFSGFGAAITVDLTFFHSLLEHRQADTSPLAHQAPSQQVQSEPNDRTSVSAEHPPGKLARS